MPKRFGLGLRFSDGLDTLPQHVHQLRHKEKSDVIVPISHLGLAQDMELVHKVEGVDVILSGHTHDRLFSPVIIGKTLLIQSGFSGSFLGRLDLEIADGHVLGCSHELIEVSERTIPDSGVENGIPEQLKPHRVKHVPQDRRPTGSANGWFGWLGALLWRRWCLDLSRRSPDREAIPDRRWMRAPETGRSFLPWWATD